MADRYISPTDQAVLNVECPKCGAQPGDLCITKLSRVLYDVGQYHAARRDKELFERSRRPLSAGSFGETK